MASIEFENVAKIYENSDKYAIHPMNLRIEDGDFIVIVGPSGCGKSTTLRMVSGLESISEGKLYIGDRLVNDLEPMQRDIAMVFQNYALYPHMTVYNNIAFPLKSQSKDRAEIEIKVKEVAQTLQIEEFLERKPGQLSGGQRQRVALARAMVRSPKVFLLDEPLSNLDAKLRVEMRQEIVNLHKKLSTTFIYVTHDQTEAMTMADKVVVLNKGHVEQYDTPMNLYLYPQSKFVGTFIGLTSMNILDGEIIVKDKVYLNFEGNHLIMEEELLQKLKKHKTPMKIYLGIRPENTFIYREKCQDSYPIEVESYEVLGSEINFYYRFLAGEEIHSSRMQSEDLQIEDIGQVDFNSYLGRAYLKFSQKHIHLFDYESEKSLLERKS